MRARLVKEIGKRGSLRVYWDVVLVEKVEPCDQCPEGHPTRIHQNDCPNCCGGGKPGYHNAHRLLRDALTGEDVSFGKAEDFPDAEWPTVCENCGAVAPVRGAPRPAVLGGRGPDVGHQVSVSRLYDTPSGEVEPGDVYEYRMHEPGECHYWDKCDGVHLLAMTPNGESWDISSRASNCTMREDRQHRCWVVTGSAEAGTLTVGKGGLTCSAGGGSIQVTGWHGFLQAMNWNG